jgi:hypothetical protein
LVQESEFGTADGAVRMINFMPRRGSGLPCVMRIVEGVRGPVPMRSRTARSNTTQANYLGLLAEAYDVGRRREIGNFPQAFSHLTLILAAPAISGEGAKVEQGAV